MNARFCLVACLAATTGPTLANGGEPEYRTFDGHGNNVANPDWGAAHAWLLRTPGAASFDDGSGDRIDPSGARAISNQVSAQIGGLGNRLRLTSMYWQWGQLIDHDFALAEPAGRELILAEVPADDEFFVPGAFIRTTRAPFERDENGVRQFPNEISHYIDASYVYGSDEERADALRSFEGGRLLVSNGFLPRNDRGLANANESRLPDERLFLAGDTRANEQPGLTALHALMVLEHNHWADRLAADNPAWDDERIYQTARHIVSALTQKITYEDWLPPLIGPGGSEHGLPPSDGYDPTVNAGMSAVFTGAAYRLGHTMLNDRLLRFEQDGSVYTARSGGGGHLELFQAFFVPQVFDDARGFEAILRGLAWQEANEIDPMAIDSVRSFLFGLPLDGGLDLITLNIVRGRDLGLPSYNNMREELGFGRAASFEEMTGEPAGDAPIAQRFAAAYETVDDVDLWPGMLAEPHVEDGLVGRTLAAIVRDQFRRLRDGDRFFYEWDPVVAPHLTEIRSTTLSDIIERNTDATLQPDAFVMPCGGLDVAAPRLALTPADAVAFLGMVEAGLVDADIDRDGFTDFRDVLAWCIGYDRGCSN